MSRRQRGRRRLLAGVLTVVTAGGLVAAGQASAASATSGPEIQVLSNRADLVTGGDALVEVAPPRGASVAGLRVTLNGEDITSAFDTGSSAQPRGLVAGLVVGDNTVTARLGNGPASKLTITNRSDTGPVFAGPQVQPWVCATEENGLGVATDRGNCHAPARSDLFYRSAVTKQFQPYDQTNPPPDLATTTTDEGLTVPFIVRLETGTMDRGVYKTAMLYDPDASDDVAALKAFNGKALVPFGGGCLPQHKQAAPPNVLGGGDAAGLLDGSINAGYALSKGYVVLSSSNNILGQQCNNTVSAETLIMLKERVAETARMPIRYTIGQGCSGGSVQQFVIAAAYPGVLDGLLPMCSFPDLAQVVQEAQDCTLMNRVFNETSPGLWANPAQRNATQGYVSPTPCVPFYDGNVPVKPGFAKNWFDPDNSDGCVLPEEKVYDAENNPDGVRCTLQDYTVAVLGRRAEDGFANRPYDNVGLQYGLRALESGEITPEQFVDLNVKIGGWDIDWNWQPQRSKADAGALVNAYRSGWVMSAHELAKVPIIDLRGIDPATNHTDVHSYSIRERLAQANGHHDNAIMWTGHPALLNDPTANRESFVLIDRWLARMEADGSDAPLEEKVVTNKPAQATDACWAAGTKITDMSVCRAAFPYFSNARMVAGGPLSDDVLKCALKPLDRDDYDVAFSGEQWSRLNSAFPSGACDFRKPGVAQQPSVPWLTFSDGPGGRALGPPPVSTR